MGGAMVINLLKAGYTVRAFDTNPERLQTVVEGGAIGTQEIAEAILPAEVVCLSLPSSSACVEVVETSVLPHLRPGHVIIDFGTTTLPETRRLAELVQEKQAHWLEAPVSGGEGGAKRGQLRTFVGGEPEIFDRVRPLLETVGGSEHLTYCGTCGAGQVVKGVNQLAMGLGAAAYLEAVAFGIRAGMTAGVTPDIIAQAVGSENERWRTIVLQTARAVQENRAEQIGVKFRELPYFLQEATESGFALPLTETLYSFCDTGPRVVIDDNREAPSFWHELMRYGNEPD